ncbi:MAG: GNAT family N-acetyltransferase, partial [Bacteroidales bacterium]|nr:GNAT family N-acetyltransferase [Bacteroidales bacterium]
IQSVFVVKAYRRQGLFQLFYDHIKAIAQHDDSIGGIRLYVDKTNIPAQKTYTKVGMNGEHYQLFEWMKD